MWQIVGAPRHTRDVTLWLSCTTDNSNCLTDPTRFEITGVDCTSGPSCSKLTTSLVNISLNFQKLISQICQYFLLKKCEKLLKLLSFFQQKISVFLVIKS